VRSVLNYDLLSNARERETTVLNDHLKVNARQAIGRPLLFYLLRCFVTIYLRPMRTAEFDHESGSKIDDLGKTMCCRRRRALCRRRCSLARLVVDKNRTSTVGTFHMATQPFVDTVARGID
jgi:hypothetical protein